MGKRKPAEQSKSTWRILFDATLALHSTELLALVLTFVLIGYLIMTWWAEGPLFGAPTQPVDLSFRFPLILGVMGLGAGAWAGTLFYHSQGKSRGRGVIQPKSFDRNLAVIPTLLLIACCLLTVNMAQLRAFQGGAVLLMIAWLSFFRLFHVTTRFTFTYATRQAERADRAARETLEARMSALRAQMNPHFLFNALNTVASLVRSDPSSAERAVSDLSSVLRRSLGMGSESHCPLADEVTLLEAYLAVEQARLGDRLGLAWDIDPESRAARIPSMTLQPLVENALHHGIGNLIDGGHIVIGSRRYGERLILWVSDNGQGAPPDHRERIGLGNLRRRLETLYGESAELRLERSTGWTNAVVELPYDVDRETPDG